MFYKTMKPHTAAVVVIVAVVLLPYKFTKSTELRFTNLICESYDKKFVEFQQCHLKVQRRGVINLNIYGKLHQLPVVSNITLHAMLFKKASGYRPFLYNLTVNLCEFFINPKRVLPLKLLYDALKDVSNINHTCPYNHDIIVKDMRLLPEYFKMLPLPPGDYLLHLKIKVKYHLVAVVKAFLLLNL